MKNLRRSFLRKYNIAAPQMPDRVLNTLLHICISKPYHNHKVSAYEEKREALHRKESDLIENGSSEKV